MNVACNELVHSHHRQSLTGNYTSTGSYRQASSRNRISTNRLFSGDFPPAPFNPLYMQLHVPDNPGDWRQWSASFIFSELGSRKLSGVGLHLVASWRPLFVPSQKWLARLRMWELRSDIGVYNSGLVYVICRTCRPCLYRLLVSYQRVTQTIYIALGERERERERERGGERERVQLVSESPERSQPSKMIFERKLEATALSS